MFKSVPNLPGDGRDTEVVGVNAYSDKLREGCLIVLLAMEGRAELFIRSGLYFQVSMIFLLFGGTTSKLSL